MGNVNKKHILAVALVLMLLSIMVSIWIGKQVSHAASEQTRIYKIMDHAEAMLSGLKDAENGKRGYILTHNDNFLLSYNTAKSKIDNHYQKLIESTKDSSSYLILLDIKPIINQKMLLMEQAVTYEKNGQSKEAHALVESGFSNALMAQIQSKMTAFGALEKKLLEQRNKTFRSTIRYLVFGMLSSALVGLTIVYAAFIRIQRLKNDAQRKAAFQSALLSSADAAILSISSDGVITSFNSGAEKLLGYEANAVVGIKSAAIFHDKAEVNELALRLSPKFNVTSLSIIDIFVLLIEDKKSDMREWTYIRKDGSAIPVMLSVTKIHGLKEGFLCVARDITAIKAQENELQITEQRYISANNQLNKVVSFSLDVICVIGADGLFIQVSNACHAVWGYSADELLGRPFLDFVHPDDRKKTQAKSKEIIAGNPTVAFKIDTSIKMAVPVS